MKTYKVEHGFEEKGTPKVGFVIDKHVFREQWAMCVKNIAYVYPLI